MCLGHSVAVNTDSSFVYIKGIQHTLRWETYTWGQRNISLVRMDEWMRMNEQQRQLGNMYCSLTAFWTVVHYQWQNTAVCQWLWLFHNVASEVSTESFCHIFSALNVMYPIILILDPHGPFNNAWFGSTKAWICNGFCGKDIMLYLVMQFSSCDYFMLFFAECMS